MQKLIMPQASSQTLEDWPGDDADALALLKTNFNLSRGGMFSWKDPAYEPTKQELAALQYLFEEWDYGWYRP